MKTKTNKNAIATNTQRARDLEAQARALREQNQQIRLQVKAEEEAILRDMVQTVEESGDYLTASQIAAKLGGAMSVHEVAGQLTFARNSMDSGRKPQPYFGPSHYHMTHDTMVDAAPTVEVDSQRVTRHFAEVDESGKVIPGGRQFKQTEHRNVYAIKR